MRYLAFQLKGQAAQPESIPGSINITLDFKHLR